jgi:hypothetical protein
MFKQTGKNYKPSPCPACGATATTGSPSMAKCNFCGTIYDSTASGKQVVIQRATLIPAENSNSPIVEQVIQETEGKMTRAFFVSADFKNSKESKLIDGMRLAKNLEQAIELLNKDGYEIVSVTPITSGFGTYAAQTGAFGYSYGYGYSYTEGIIVVGRKA